MGGRRIAAIKIDGRSSTLYGSAARLEDSVGTIGNCIAGSE